MTELRTVLMFAYWFPPCVRWPTATLRVTGLARHLPRHGWRPVVVAPDLTDGLCSCVGCGVSDTTNRVDGVEVVRLDVGARLGVQLARTVSPDTTSQPSSTSSSWRSRILAPIATYFEMKTDWVVRAQREGPQLAARYSADVVWTTSPPFQSVRIGSHLKERIGLPWIADLRDEISRVRGQDGLAARTAMWARTPLRSHLRKADRVVGITPELAQLDASWLGRSVDTLSSGFDPTEWDVPVPDDDVDVFVIAYAGRFYPGHIDPTPALAGLRTFFDTHPNSRSQFRFVYYGEDGGFLRAKAAQFDLADVIEDRGFLHGSAFRRAVRSADVLLTLTSLDGHSGIPGGKLYDYLGANRPILAVPGSDEYVSSVLAKTGAGRIARDPGAVAHELHAWFEQWQRQGQVEHYVNEEERLRFSINEAAARYSRILNHAIV